MRAVYLRELSSYFSSMIAYITVGLLLAVLGLVLWVFPDFSLLQTPFASIDALFEIAPLIFIFLIPAFTMRTFAEEKQAATLEVLLTRPISAWHIVTGKYLATLSWLAIALVPTLIYVYSIYQLGSPPGNIDLGQIGASYFGLFLLGAVFCAIGVFASAQTSNQIVAFSFALCCTMDFISSAELLHLQAALMPSSSRLELTTITIRSVAASLRPGT